MLSAIQQIMGQHHPLISKLYADAPKNNIAT
jgi:hypothetical protein